LWGHFEVRAFDDEEGPKRIVGIVLEMIAWSDAVFATAFHSAQIHSRSGPGTPLEGLRRLDWLTYWGAPYVELIGRERLLRAPCYLVDQYGTGILMQASPRFDGPDVLESDKLLIGLEQYLGADLFAGPEYPDASCQVPTIDASETICHTENPETSQSADASVIRDSARLPTLILELASEAEAAAASKRIALDYSLASISAVDTLLDEFRAGWIGRSDRSATTAKRHLASVFGAYVGEVLRRARGGQWIYNDASADGVDAIVLEFGEVRVFPMDKAYKRLSRGNSESLELYAMAVLRELPRP